MLALRAFVFVVINIALPYIGILVQQYETDTYVNVCRTLLILLGEPEVACFWVVVYALCIGYHIRQTKKKDEYAPSSLEDQLSYSIQAAKSAPVLPSIPGQTAEDPASLLREALASRRGGGFARDV